MRILCAWRLSGKKTKQLLSKEAILGGFFYIIRNKISLPGVCGGIPGQIATVEQGIVSYMQKFISYFSLEILRDVEGSKYVAF